MTGIPLTRDDELGLWYQEPKSDPTHSAFPLAEAEALIDPNDPAVRERICTALNVMFDDEEAVDATLAVLDALRGAK